MKKILLMALAVAIAMAIGKALLGRQRDHDVWAEYVDEV